MAHLGPSELHPAMQNWFLALGTTRESSGAHLGPIFGRVSDLKKCHVQALDFLFDNFLFLV